MNDELTRAMRQWDSLVGKPRIRGPWFLVFCVAGLIACVAVPLLLPGFLHWAVLVGVGLFFLACAVADVTWRLLRRKAGVDS